MTRKKTTKEKKELSEELKNYNERLSKSIKNKNFDDASVAQALYEADPKRIQDSNERLQKCLKRRDKISSKRRKVMINILRDFLFKLAKSFSF